MSGAGARRSGLNRHLILIGLRGAGKSTVGRCLAARLGAAFTDTDARIAEAFGRSIAQVFREAGEPSFRAKEASIFEEALREPPHVISVGGGAVLLAENRARMRTVGDCIWLDADDAVLCARLAGDARTTQSRPALVPNANDALDEMRRVRAARSELYHQAAHVRIETDDLGSEAVADQILRWIAARPRNPEEAP